MDISGRRSLTDTPCKGVCSTTNLGDAICKGCKRTSHEVIEWNTYTNEQKIAINKRLQSVQ
jgi:predicted Fe-S protein YdhL (DUF1289 family)